MKLVTTVRLTGALLAGVSLWLFSANSFAATASGTTISNTATVNYSVGGTAQAPIGSSPTGNTVGAGTATTFVVDTKLSLTVTTVDTADVAVAPGQNAVVQVFQVTNTGNSTQGVTFSTIQQPSGTASPFAGGGTANFLATSATVHVSASNTASYSSTNDTASSLFSLAPGASNYVFIVANIPAGQSSASVAVESLIAQVAATGASYAAGAGAAITTDQSSQAWTPGTVQIIFSNPATLDVAVNSGKASSRDAWIVQASALTITKGTPTIIYDPTGDTTKHAIPGAVLQYTVTIANSGSATAAATGIAMTDGLPANTNWGGTSTGATGGTLAVTTPGVNGGAQFSCPDGSVTTKTGTSPYTNVSCDFSQTTANTITVSGVYLRPGDTATIVYTVTIQ